MKKTVKYDINETKVIVIGLSALVKPIDHPDFANVSNLKHVVTSLVVDIRKDGTFETLNTIYIPG